MVPRQGWLTRVRGTGDARVWVLDRQRGAQAGPVTRRATDRQRAADHLNPIGQPLQAGAGGGVRTTSTVVGDLHQHHVALAGHLDPSLGGPGVLGHVRQRLGAQVVDGGLEVRRDPRDVDVEEDPARCALDQNLQRCAQAALGQGTRVQAAGQIIQIRPGLHQVLLGPVQVVCRLGPPAGGAVQGPGQLLEAALRALAKRVLEPAPFVVGGGQQPAARRGQFVELRADLSLQRYMGGGQPGRTGHRVDQHGVTQHEFVVDQDRERRTVTGHIGGGNSRPRRGQLHLGAVVGDIGLSPGRPVADLQGWGRPPPPPTGPEGSPTGTPPTPPPDR